MMRSSVKRPADLHVSPNGTSLASIDSYSPPAKRQQRVHGMNQMVMSNGTDDCMDRPDDNMDDLEFEMGNDAFDEQNIQMTEMQIRLDQLQAQLADTQKNLAEAVAHNTNVESELSTARVTLDWGHRRINELQQRVIVTEGHLRLALSSGDSGGGSSVGWVHAY